MSDKSEAMKTEDFKLRQLFGNSKLDIIYADVQFGNPKCNCRNFGICTVTEVIDFTPTPLVDEKAIASITFMINGKFKFQFLKKAMTQNTYKKHFAKDSFIIETTYSFLILNKKIEIKKGIYSIAETENFINLLF